MVGKLQKLGNFWYAFVLDEELGEVYHVQMPEGWEPLSAQQEVDLVVPPTEH